MTTRQGLKIMDRMFKACLGVLAVGTLASLGGAMVRAAAELDEEIHALTELDFVVTSNEVSRNIIVANSNGWNEIVERPADDVFVAPSNGWYTFSNGTVRPLVYPTRSQIRRAMNEHREDHPRCYVCGTSKDLFRQATYIKFVEGYERPEMGGKEVTARDWLKAHGLYIEAKNLPVHHVKSQKPFPELAATKKNLRTMCWSCHFWLGHLQGHYKDHEANLLVVIDAVKAAVASNTVSYNSTKGVRHE